MKYSFQRVVLFISLMLLATVPTWAGDITTDDIIYEVLPANSGNSVEVVSAVIDGNNTRVTIKVTKTGSYTINENLITAVPMVKLPQQAPRRAPGFAGSLPLHASSTADQYYFDIPNEYDGAYVTAKFVIPVAGTIHSLSEITDLDGHYTLATDISADEIPAAVKTGFRGHLNGNFHKIYNLSGPLFESTSGAHIYNLMLEDVSISGSGNVGAITRVADGATRIYNCGILSGRVSGTVYVGGLVGKLDGTSRVINCFSYADVSGGTDMGGIVGYNNYASKNDDIKTMVMNCIFYGDISGGGNISPVYGGLTIDNLEENKGLNTFNYYRYESPYSKNGNITTGKYNCALAVEEEYLTRVEIYRQLLNSNRKLAAWYALGDASKGYGVNNEMAKWVLETADQTNSNPMPYPVLKAQGYYHSIVNYDAEHAPQTPESTKSLTINVGSSPLPITDKDPDHYNFNYHKVQLPYYDGDDNYKDGKVVTGWEVSVTGGKSASEGYDVVRDANGNIISTPYNFADRLCTVGRVYSQGAYFDVPEGVSSITITPHWAKAVFVSDANLDKVYSQKYCIGESVNALKTPADVTDHQFDANDNGYDCEVNGITMKVFTDIGKAVDKLTGVTSPTVYDYAVVLVGNLHLIATPSGGTKPFTIMSADFDKDHEPDFSLIYTHKERGSGTVSPIRFDFLNMPGLAMAQKPNGSQVLRNVSIFKPKGWFEVTNTCLVHFVQFEYDDGGKTAAPVILLGGVYDQFVSTQSSKLFNESTKQPNTKYIHVGSNAWFKEFGNGTHSDGWQFTPHIPISVTGGDYGKFYLSGTYRPDAIVMEDNAECYISGGRFGQLAGAGQQQIDGDVNWQIRYADIDEFYGGGINAGKPITGNINIDIKNSNVKFFCGGPKFGDMQKKGTTTISWALNKEASSYGSRNKEIVSDRVVTTNAEGCTFGNFYGAGYGGNSYFRVRTQDSSTAIDWPKWQNDYTTNRGKYIKNNNGIATDFDYEYFVGSNGAVWGRFYVQYASFSMAQTNNVTSTLTDCKITGDYYGGGCRGKVNGLASSILNNCTVDGNVFGGGYSANVPTIDIRSAAFIDIPTFDADAGVFGGGTFSSMDNYTWTKGTLTNNSSAIDTNNYKIKTDVDLSSLGQVKETDLKIQGNTIVRGLIDGRPTGGVFGGGDASAVYENTKVTITGGENCSIPNVFGGGNLANVYGSAVVDMQSGAVSQSIYGGGNIADVSVNTTVTMSGGSVNGNVYGGGNLAGVDGDTEVTISSGTIGSEGRGGVEYGNVYGGGKGKQDNVTAGLVKGSTKVLISQAENKTTRIYHNVYGGGAYGSVGDYDYDATSGLPTGLKTTAAANSGKTEVYIKGGTFGWNGKENGMVFGSSRGDVGAPGSIEDKLAWVYDTHVTIGDTATNATITTATPIIKGSIYGGGENGHNLHNAYVRINGGTIGILTGDNEVVTNADNSTTTYAAYNYPYRGNVYGGGCGTDMYDSDNDEIEDSYNPLAGVVQGNAFVNITGGHVVHNVYGAGAMGSVGTVVAGAKTKVNISGGRIGSDGTRNGNVFGAARGEYGKSTAASGLANVSKTEVNISYTSTPTADNEGKTVQLIAGSVFGGGEAGTVKGSVAVNMTGGLILKDLYGGGALADTQTSNWNTAATPNTWTDTDKKSTLHTTTVRLTGGRIVEEVFGGGLGEEGKPAYVWGDVLVDLNGETTMDNTTGKPTVNGTATTNASGCVVGQLFGGNNINGTPKGDVMVHVYATQNKNTGAIATKVPLTFTEPETDKVTYWSDQATSVGLTPATIIGTATTDEAKINLLKAAIEANRYDVKAVYGGGNQAAYIPVTPNTSTTTTPNGSQTQVIIEGCSTTSIETVYGGGNAAAVPETNVEIRSAYEIYNVFGGGNGYSATNNHTDPSAPNYNPGADVGVYKKGSTETTYGTGNANAILKGGLIHEAYGGSNQKGNIKGKININTAPVDGGCDLCVDKLVGAGKNADVDGDLIMVLGCKPTTKTPLVFAGADNADVNGNVELTITSGTFGQVFGGNNLGGAIKGHIKLNIEETGCNPIVIDELYLGGNQAAYSIYGYYEDTQDNKVKPRTAAMHAITDPTATGYVAPLTNPLNTDNKHPFPYAEPVLNVISATSIGKVFGGGYGAGAVMHADPTVNINMIKGTPNGSESTSIGTIGDVFGGGNEAEVIGNPTVNIGTETTVTMTSVDDDSNTTDVDESQKTVEGAHITRDVFGGGNQASVTGNTQVNICAKYNATTQKWESVTPGTAGVTIDGTQPTGGFGRGVFGGGNQGDVCGNSYVYFGGGSVNQTIYGGGCEADVKGNTNVTMLDGYVFDGVCGGGLKGSVGTFTRTTETGHTEGSTHDNGEKCIGGKPDNFTSGTGKCTVKITGGQVGPATVATQGMTAAGGPVSEGWVWGAGRGAVVGPDTDPDTDFRTYVYETDVTIGGTAFIMEGIVGGGEFGRVRHNTWVKIQDHCQIGVGAGTDMVDSNGKPIRYTDGYDYGNGETTNQFVDPTTRDITTANALKACSHFPFGKNIGTEQNPNWVYKTYDPYADEFNDPYPGGSTTNASDGKTWIGCVFAGGSGYFPYKKKDGTGYDWLQSAGLVEGDAKIEITGGHILTNVYGGNEVTNVLGKSIVKMSGGTVGVPRTKAQIEALPMCGYIYGAGKGDERTHFNTATNVGSAEVEVSGGIVYGSVYGGGEDGHVLGDAKVTIKDGAKIGTVGTSYFDGHVFGGGRGLSGIAQTAGTVGGNVTLNIEGGTMLGSVYGGGRLASVGTQFTAPNDDNYGNFKEDGGGKTYGHVTVNISGGTIGKLFTPDTNGDLPAGAQYSGNVFGGSMGRLTLLNGDTNSFWPKMAQVKESNVNIYGNATIYKSVYGGGELGTVRDDAYVTIGGKKTADADSDGNVTVETKPGSPTIRRDVYGGGYGSLDRNYTVFTVKELESDNQYYPHTYAFTPMQFAGCVGNSTYVNVVGGYIRKSVYGGGEMASVGVINCRAAELTSGISTEGKVYFHDAVSNKDYYYENMVKHADATKEFALSWPYEFNYVTGYPGATHVKVTGGRLGLKYGDTDKGFDDNGDVYGAGKGMAGDFKDYLFCANVGSTDVVIDHAASNSLTAYSGTDDLIAGAVYGGGEDGHVMGNSKVTMKKGFVYHSIYGAGSGKGKFSTKLLKIGKTPGSTTETDYYTRNIYSITAGKVFGNSTVEMSGGMVVRNVYGGGNMGSVGKGNYAGGTDDYSYYEASDKTYNGYGEALEGNLWSGTGKFTTAFLNSGKCTVKISGGTIGYIDTANPLNSMYPYDSPASLPYGNVFGGCRGESAPNITESPRYLYSPEFFVGYANETEVTIEGTTTKILGSVYGGGMDGHIRRDAHVIIKGGEIGIPFDATNKTNVKTEHPDNIQWLARGNVYGAGSGIGKYKYDFNYDNDYADVLTYNGKDTKEEDFSTSAGSVTRFTTVEIQGGTIHRNVYGGGSLASIGAPKIPTSRTDNPVRRDDDATGTKGKQTLNEVKISGGQIGGDYSYDANGNYVYGGRVFGGSRGDATLDATKFSTSMFTSVTINPNASDDTKPAIAGSVFGGGEVGIVKGCVDVTMNGGTVNHDVYGGGALANTNTENPSNSTSIYTTTVDLFGGMIKGDAYGGGLGQLATTEGVKWTQAEIDAASEGDPAYGKTTNDWKVEPTASSEGAGAVKAMVNGDVTVTLGKADQADRSAATAFKMTRHTATGYTDVVKSGRVFGCNNLNGSPQGSVLVTVNRTVTGKDVNDADLKRTEITRDSQTKEITNIATPHTYEVTAVYGGGNLADYTATGKKAYVIINGCDVSVRDVYGGGNAAAVPATDVLVNGAWEIEHVFGGGNGKDDYTLDGGTTWKTNPGANVNGNTNTLLLGGLIHEAYGGSNEKGTITGSVTIDAGQGQPTYCENCPLDVRKIVAAGKNADVNGDLKVIMGCKPSTKIPLLYAGADNANVNGDVELTITSGNFGKVFGGNNEGGIILGHIKLNIEETGDCATPINIDELYLGGNQAAYSVYGYYVEKNTDNTPKLTAAGKLSIKPRESATDSHKAIKSIDGATNTFTEWDSFTSYDKEPELNVISATSIKEVFGGGYGVGGDMYANPTVNINMIPGSHAASIKRIGTGNDHDLGEIGDVYGGGNAADVYGNTTINIGTASSVTVNSLSYNSETQQYTAGSANVEGAYITGNVYGGGKLANVGKYHLETVNGKTDEKIDIVGNTFVNIGAKKTDDTYTSVAYSAEGAQGITIGGNVFGGGKGEAAESGDGAFRCGKAMVTGGTNVVIGNGTFGTLEGSTLKAGTGTVYGGGEVGRVEKDTKVTIGLGTSAPDVKGDVFGAGAGKKTHGYSALVRGDATVTIQGKAKVGKSVYGGGETASVGKFNVVNSLPKEPLDGGTCKVVIKDEAEITGNIFGACKGVEPDWATAQTSGHVTSDEQLTPFTDEADYLKFLKTLALTSNTDVIIDGSAKVYGNVYGGGQRGVTLGNVDVNIMNGTVSKDVYGGGALADTNTGNWDDDKYVEAKGLTAGESIVTGLYTLSGTEYSEIKEANTLAASGTTYYIKGAWAKDEKSALYKTTVNLLGGTISGDAYGGGLGQLGTNPVEAKVYGDTKVNLNGLEVGDYVASIHQSLTEGTTARLVSIVDDNNQIKEYQINDAVQGAIVKHIFGCNNLNGSPQGKAQVHVFKTQRAGQTRITNAGDVTTAKIHVEKDANGDYDVTHYDVQAVYGGGNMAAYVPKDLTNGTTKVIIDGCDRTSIGQVYGGGNAASTPATEVTVNGTFEIAEVFGGGNGKDKITINTVEKDNPGANVGFYDYSAEENIYNTKEKRTTDPQLAPTFINKYVYGSGKAAVNIFGGTIHRVFGGSNTKGNVRLSAITLLEDAETCEFCVDEAYGGGKSAPMDAEAKLLMACIPGLKEVYGGAQAADVFDDVTVTVTNGTFDRVFGGNNLSGTIRGKITVNIEETGCKPVIIGELYGGGNQAAYSVYGYKQMNEVVDGETKLVWKARESNSDNTTDGVVDAPTTPYDDPQVNVKSFTSIGTIYGGGYGEGAVMVGNPTVNINVVHGDKKDYYDDSTYEGTNSQPVRYYDATTYEFKELTRTIDGHEVTLPNHKQGDIGAIGNVFGGGNAAKVIGNTNVNVGTKATVNFVSKDDDAHKNVPFVGVDIRGNVYGGGNNAEVTGDTNVTIGKKETTP